MAEHSVGRPKVYRDNIVIDGLVVAPPSGEFAQALVTAGVTACNWTITSHRDDTLTAPNKIAQFYRL
jgi:hypothetical protein